MKHDERKSNVGAAVPPAEKPFCKINEAARRSGLSVYFIRKGCRDGSIPCIKCGEVYLIDFQGMVDRLRDQARG